MDDPDCRLVKPVHQVASLLGLTIGAIASIFIFYPHRLVKITHVGTDLGSWLPQTNINIYAASNSDLMETRVVTGTIHLVPPAVEPPQIGPFTNTLLPHFVFAVHERSKVEHYEDWRVLLHSPFTGEVMRLLRELPSGRLTVAGVDSIVGNTNMLEYVTLGELMASTNSPAVTSPIGLPLVVLRREVLTNHIAAHTTGSLPVKEMFGGQEVWIHHSDAIFVPARDHVVTNWVIRVIRDGRPIELQTISR